MNTFKRNEDGLLDNVNYIFNNDGTINWKAMIPKEFLVIQKDYEKEVVARYNKELRDLDPSEIDDRYLMILLGGIKYLLRLRGYKSVTQKIDYVDAYKAVATCTIEFLPNFETNGEPQTFSDTSSATVQSVSGVFKLFLESIAANRAFVRAVRNGLGINIVAKDEFDERASKQFVKNSENLFDSVVTNESITPHNILEKKCKTVGVSFDLLKKRALDFYKKGEPKITEDPVNWSNFKSIQNQDAYTLLSRLEKVYESKHE